MSVIQRLATLPALILSATLLVQCNDEKPAPLDATNLFSEMERAIDDHYVASSQIEGLSADSIPSRSAMYGAALAAARSGNSGAIDTTAAASGSSLNQLVDYLQNLPGEERNQATRRAIDGYLAGLPYGTSSFVSASSLALNRSPRRNAGIGLILRRQEDGRFLVIDTLEGSPAYRARLRPGAFLIGVDGVAIDGMDLEEVVGRIRGPKETEVELEFNYGSERVMRNEVSFQNILSTTWRSGERSYDYFVLRSTLEGSADQLRNEVLRRGRRDAMILDLRKLHPGDYQESFRVAEIFVSDQKLGSIEESNGRGEEFFANPDQVYTGEIYLIIGNYASPFAETLAMAMSASERVTIIGSPIREHAFVARTIPLSGGHELRLAAGVLRNSNGTLLIEDGLPLAHTIDDFLPTRALQSQPDPEDPAQRLLAELLGIELTAQ